MSNFSKYMSLLMVPIVLSACKDNEDTRIINSKPEWEAPTEVRVNASPRWVAYLQQEDDRPSWAVDFSNDDPAPEWEAPDNLRYSSSMTAVLTMPDFIKLFEGQDDMIAAFIGEECRGIGDIVASDGISYYFVNIKGSDTESGKVVFKYYNRTLHALYTADNDVHYQLDGVYGTVASPQTAVFKNPSKYPLQMTLEVAISQDLGGFTAGAGDMIAVFAGDECRAAANIDPYAETVSLDVLGRTEGERLDIYYYTAQYKSVLMHNGTIAFAQDAIRRVVPSLRALKSTDVYLQVDTELRPYSNDLSQMGIFVGDDCRSYSLAVGQGRFHTMVLADPDDDVTVKYYTDELQVIFETQPLKMKELMASDEKNYYTVPLVTDKRYPLQMQMIAALPPDLTANEGSGDIMAAFIGEECRGVATIKEAEGQRLYYMDIVRQLSESQKVTVKYYCAKTGLLYQSMPFVFEHNVVSGSELYPEYLYFNEVAD